MNFKFVDAKVACLVEIFKNELKVLCKLLWPWVILIVSVVQLSVCMRSLQVMPSTVCLINIIPRQTRILHVCELDVFYESKSVRDKKNWIRISSIDENLSTFIQKLDVKFNNFEIKTKSPPISRLSLLEFSFRENHKVSSWSAWVPDWAFWLVVAHWLDLALSSSQWCSRVKCSVVLSLPSPPSTHTETTLRWFGSFGLKKRKKKLQLYWTEKIPSISENRRYYAKEKEPLWNPNTK